MDGTPADHEPPLRPAWEDTPDETDVFPVPAHGSLSGETDPAILLGPLADATEALARLDAGAAAAPEAVCDGLVARMALTEAAGWLAQVQAWVHPLDLALRALSLTGPAALVAVGAGRDAMPQTFADTVAAEWDAVPLDAMADADRVLAEALALARLLRRLAGTRGRRLLADVGAAADALAPFGGGALDPGRFEAWRAACAVPAAPPRRRFAGRREGVRPPMPPLLVAAQAAQTWMEHGITETAIAPAALLAAAGIAARSGVVRTVFLPVWAAWPAVGAGERDALPGLRSDVADRLLGRGMPVTWPIAFLHLVAEGARTGQRALDRLLVAAGKGRDLTASCDRRSRLPDAVDALLRAPVLTPKALAARLRIAPQTGTALLRELAAAGLVREVTGRGSFRAFALA
jgi:hypothetical protein